VYQFLRDSSKASESVDVASGQDVEQEAGRSEKTVDPAAAIATAALERDRLCEQTMQMFLRLRR